MADAFAAKTYVNSVVITSDQNNASQLFALTKVRNKESNFIEGMRLITSNIKDIERLEHETQDDDPPLHSFFITQSEYGDKVDSYVQVSGKMLKIFDRDLTQRMSFSGLNIRNCMDVHQSYLYTINDSIITPFKTINHEDDTVTKDPKHRYKPAGFYAYDLAKLLQGKIEMYRLATAIGGVSNYIDNSKFSDRFSFIENFNSIAVIPFPHLNLINCVGMGQKHEYLLWREKNGFFTALDKRGNLQTWSKL